MTKPRRRSSSGWSLFATLAVAVLLAALMMPLAAADPVTEPSDPDGTAASQETGAIEVIEDAPPRIIVASQKAPVYPPAAQAARFTGTVKVKATVKEDGSVGDVEVLECDHKNVGFEEAAIDAVQKWRFEPGTKDGAPVETEASFRLNFRSAGPGSGPQVFATGMSGVNSEVGSSKTTSAPATQGGSAGTPSNKEKDD